jgi:MOSC domain-containing protein YiiM
MHLSSVNISKVRSVAWGKREVRTGIFKQPVYEKIWVNRLSLDGDAQADLTVHGGEAKAVYAYSLEHYAWWAENWEGGGFSAGAFGENLTIAGFDEDQVYVGDIFQVGEAVLQVTQPRFPCYKLGMKFGDNKIIKTFMASRRLGVYFRVIKEGSVQKDDKVERLVTDPQKFPVRELAFLLGDPQYRKEDLKRVLTIKSLDPDWRERITRRLNEMK